MASTTDSKTAAAVIELATCLVRDATVVGGDEVSINLDRLEATMRETGVKVERAPRAPFFGELEAVRAEKHVYATRAAKVEDDGVRKTCERRVATLQRREEELLNLLWPDEWPHPEDPPDPL